MNPLSSLSLAQLQKAVELREQIDSLKAELNGITDSEDGAAAVDAQTGRNAAWRVRLAAARKARWARQWGEAVPAPTRKPVPTRRGKRIVSPETRAKLVEAAWRRWARVKGGK